MTECMKNNLTQQIVGYISIYVGLICFVKLFFGINVWVRISRFILSSQPNLQLLLLAGKECASINQDRILGYIFVFRIRQQYQLLGICIIFILLSSVDGLWENWCKGQVS